MIEILNVRALDVGYLVNGYITVLPTDENYQLVMEWVDDGKEVMAKYTTAELAQQLEDAKPKVVTMRQARLALLQSNLLATVDTTIATGTDEAMKIEWEYATEVLRDWDSLITLTTAMGMTSAQLDDLFLLASAL